MTGQASSVQDKQPPPMQAIAIVIAVSAAAFAGEMAVADHLPWGEEARGVIAVLLGAVAALWLTLAKGGSLADLGLARPKRWLTVPFWVLGILITFVAAQALVPQLITPYFDLPPPDMSRYDFIRGDALAAVSMALLLPLTAAIPEEVVYRGFLFHQFGRLYTGIKGGPILAALSQAVIFGLVHDDHHGPRVGYCVPPVWPQSVDRHNGAFGRTHCVGIAIVFFPCAGLGANCRSR